MIEYSAGIVTAYGSAVRAGYTGTYEDFCRQQAQYADNASAVEQAKQTAVSASQSADQAKQDAQTASTTAQQSAQSAQGSAQSAGQSAQDAQTAKTNAQTYAQSASQSAGSAQQSAQTAQAVFESIPEDYSDLSKDVDDLKADLTGSVGFEYTKSDGYFSADGSIIEAGNLTKEKYTSLIPVFNCIKIHFSLKQTQNRGNWCAYGLYDKDENFISRSVPISNVWESAVSYDVEIDNDAVKYIAFTWRSYGDGVESIRMVDIPFTINVLYDKYDATNAKIISGSFVKSINHRGYSADAPENTIPAFKMSAQHDFKYVETDVRFTSDGVPVCLHDATINRTARNDNGSVISNTINIHDITYEQALTYDFGIYKGDAYAGTRIPTFEQLLLLCRNLGLHLYIELKYDASYTKEQIKSLVDIVDRYAMSKNVSWISSYFYYLEYVFQKKSDARLGFIAEQIQDYQITNMLTLKSESNEIFIDGTVENTQTDIDKCINNGIGFEVWTVNDVNTLISLNPYVSGVTSNNLNASKVLYQESI